jgi:uncharacterized protein (DUF2252 family)
MPAGTDDELELELEDELGLPPDGTGRARTHPTVAERAARGRNTRGRCPRSSHAALDPPERDPVALLEAQAVTRVPELVPIRYGRMLASPFAFFRGAPALMAHDLASVPRTGLTAQLCGDAHLANFGGFASPERDLTFDLNDFDETLPGPFEWDVKRLAASFEVAGRDRAFAPAGCREAVLNAVGSYRLAMRRFAEMRTMEVWYARVSASDLEERLRAAGERTARKDLTRIAAKAMTRDHLTAFDKLTHVVDGQPRIRSDPPLIVPIDELFEGVSDRDAVEDYVRAVFRDYRQTLQDDRRRLLEEFALVDLARKVVGVGSVGTRCWIVLLLGRDPADPLFIQVKEAEESVLEPYLRRSHYANHGQRVVAGQRLMQAASDIFLGWHRTTGSDGHERHFYCRQLWDWKVSVDLEAIAQRALVLYAQVCGWTLARAHARSGDRVAIARYLGKGEAFDNALADFAAAYADQNERDYDALARAVRSGRIAVEEGL